ncbi:tRNA (adenosine(37)-N6)-dimethylallyltransferase MiaA [Virgifigura deserti]|uniref:tRNA (adenosine(37)-N6)-dimethylallyltransferase MiaA n=1 Tax=Virgifigura deserti TaxID=2268457 RepID=UPI003CCB8A0B
MVIAGPTASGKSAIGLAVARALDGTIINADSMQVYRELSVLTARPDASDCAAVPHRLYGFLPVAQPYSAALWRERALEEIAAASAAGRLPVVVGGTGLYLRVLMRGLAPVPEIPLAVRAATRAKLADMGGEAFHRELARRDPAMAARLNPSDRQRLARAWEVLEATGRSLDAWQREPATPTSGSPGASLGGAPDDSPGDPLGDLQFTSFVVAPARAALYAACDARFLRMLDQGALVEAERVDALGLDPQLPAMKALGIPELRRHIHGELTLVEATTAAQQATRRYAKRQMTWFRHQMADAHRLEVDGSAAQYSERLADEICNIIRHY